MTIAVPAGFDSSPEPDPATLGGGLDSKVLVLNRVYAAIRVIDARRAFTLLAKDIAELQRTFEPDRHDWVRTTRLTIAVPRIIRLFDYDRRPRRTIKLNRRNIYARDGSRCQYCGRNFPTRELTLDHVQPRVQGGGDTWTNLVCACVKCNARKGGRTPAQAGMRLIREPVQPKRNPAITVRLGSGKYDSWKAFLDEAYWTVELH